MAKLYRTMREEDGSPVCGASFSTLGARPGKDIPVDEEGNVSPATGGMSTTLDDPKKMYKPLRPRALGGEGRHPLFVLLTEALPETLSHRQDGTMAEHHVVEPTARKPFEAYQQTLHDTRKAWSRIPLEEP